MEPASAHQLLKKYGKSKIRAVFLVKKDESKFVEGIQKSTTPNDWILNRTKDKRTYAKIAKMICEYGKQIEKEAKHLKLKVINTDNNFNQRMREAIGYLKG